MHTCIKPYPTDNYIQYIAHNTNSLIKALALSLSYVLSFSFSATFSTICRVFINSCRRQVTMNELPILLSTDVFIVIQKQRTMLTL